MATRPAGAARVNSLTGLSLLTTATAGSGTFSRSRLAHLHGVLLVHECTVYGLVEEPALPVVAISSPCVVRDVLE